MSADVVHGKYSFPRMADQHLPAAYGDTAHASRRQFGKAQRRVENRLGHGTYCTFISVIPTAFEPKACSDPVRSAALPDAIGSMLP